MKSFIKNMNWWLVGIGVVLTTIHLSELWTHGEAEISWVNVLDWIMMNLVSYALTGIGLFWGKLKPEILARFVDWLEDSASQYARTQRQEADVYLAEAKQTDTLASTNADRILREARTEADRIQGVAEELVSKAEEFVDDLYIEAHAVLNEAYMKTQPPEAPPPPPQPLHMTEEEFRARVEQEAQARMKKLEEQKKATESQQEKRERLACERKTLQKQQRAHRWNNTLFGVFSIWPLVLVIGILMFFLPAIGAHWIFYLLSLLTIVFAVASRGWQDYAVLSKQALGDAIKHKQDAAHHGGGHGH